MNFEDSYRGKFKDYYYYHIAELEMQEKYKNYYFTMISRGKNVASFSDWEFKKIPKEERDIIVKFCYLLDGVMNNRFLPGII